MEHYISGFLLAMAGFIILLKVLKKRPASSILNAVYWAASIIAIIVGSLEIIFKTHDDICAFLFGIIYFVHVRKYYKKNKVEPQFTTDYIDLIREYTIAISTVLYGILKFFLLR